MVYADLILVNGHIVTLNPAQPNAQAVAIRHGKLLAIGTTKQILAYERKETKKIDIGNKTVIPGFIDAHVHGASLGRSFSQIQLRPAKSIEDIQQEVRHWAETTPTGQWIIGRGWDQDKLIGRRYPSRIHLDQAAPHHPVFLIRVCGHLGVANSEAMRLAGITKHTEAPPGGCIDKDPTGEPTGILRENALGLVFDILPEPSGEALTNTCFQACHKMVEHGITTAHWIISSAEEMRVLRKLNERRELPLRIYALIPVEYLHHLVGLGLSTGFGNDRIKIGSVKALADGSLGARTAALKHPYDDAPDTEGMLLFSRRQLERIVKTAHEADLQVAIHAIGDRTIEIVLKTIEKVLREAPKAHRHRLEHASVLNPRLIRKMKKLGIIASVQPHFVISDVWIADRLGNARARWTYPLKSLIEEGILAIGGSDAPVEPVSPLLGMHAAVAREAFPEERLTIDEALRLYTLNAAYSSFEEDVKGSLERGKFADLIVLSENPYQTAPHQIKDIRVEMTIVGGQIVYDRSL
jgi:predicted amidohydrolase YtcJ